MTYNFSVIIVRFIRLNSKVPGLRQPHAPSPPSVPITLQAYIWDPDGEEHDSPSRLTSELGVLEHLPVSTSLSAVLSRGAERFFGVNLDRSWTFDQKLGYCKYNSNDGDVRFSLGHYKSSNFSMIRLFNDAGHNKMLNDIVGPRRSAQTLGVLLSTHGGHGSDNRPMNNNIFNTLTQVCIMHNPCYISYSDNSLIYNIYRANGLIQRVKRTSERSVNPTRTSGLARILNPTRKLTRAVSNL